MHLHAVPRTIRIVIYIRIVIRLSLNSINELSHIYSKQSFKKNDLALKKKKNVFK